MITRYVEKNSFVVVVVVIIFVVVDACMHIILF